ncbi:MAG TPA: hypothetical protein DEO65_12930 [Bacillus bacterium]|uniref:DUF3311 domain-containing protein n=1 Tax=Siminovitchia fordii TaxID=254759 RepID=A0ABQ4K991_9BACI|nr:hypothetical protein [Siminovitchia fordii]GIN22287.1 hypothetical protein J1TS3_34210 [Siminovitchia fordii]HBZ10765.1 hypothetical protein [Bacillus sp. (in: firmicutes)]
MSKKAKVLFILFNVAYFTFDWMLIPYMPNPLLFGWMPLQMFLLFGLPLVAATVWAIYYNAFFKTQSHVDYK